MKKIMYMFLILSFHAVSFAADDYQPKNISEIRAQYNLLVDLRNDEEISEEIFLKKSNFLKTLSIEKFNINIKGLELQQIVPAHKIDWIGSALYVISAILILALLASLLLKIKRPLIKMLEAIARYTLEFIKRYWEIPVYLAFSIILYLSGNEYIVLLFSFLSGTLLSFSILSRRQNYKKESHIKAAAWSLTFLWGSIAIFHHNAFVGFMAVAAFITSIGFVLVMFPGVIGIGFRKTDRRFVLKLTGITFLLSLFSWLLFYTNYFHELAPIKEAMIVFKTGMVSLVPLVYFLGLGYMTFFLYRRNLVLKLICELTAFICGTFVLTISLFYEIDSMFWIGLFFMTWYAIDKYYELLYKKFDIVWAGLFLAILLAGIGYLIKSNIVFIVEAIKFLNFS